MMIVGVTCFLVATVLLFEIRINSFRPPRWGISTTVFLDPTVYLLLI